MTNHPIRRTYPRYWSKLPRQSFEQRRPARGWTTDITKKVRQIEESYRPGYTAEPSIQLVEETPDSYRVISEWMPGKGWTSPMVAAGYLPSRA